MALQTVCLILLVALFIAVSDGFHVEPAKYQPLQKYHIDHIHDIDHHPILNDFRRSIKNAGSLTELTPNKKLRIGLKKWLHRCVEPAHKTEVIEVNSKKYFVFAYVNRHYHPHIDQVFLRYAKLETLEFDHKKRVCLNTRECQSYYMMVYDQARSVECSFERCEREFQKYYISACAIGPMPASFSDEYKPAYVTGPPCSHCLSFPSCHKSLCAKAKKSHQLHHWYAKSPAGPCQSAASAILLLSVCARLLLAM